MKRYIGISYSEANFQNYWNWFSKEDLGEDIELIILSYLKNNHHDFLRCSGFILTGGVDVLPSLSGGAERYSNMPMHFLPERDAFERSLYFFAGQNHLPLLGICRGMQYVNILEGGKVIDDLSDANEIHRRITADKQHRVSIERGTLLQEICEVDQGWVNSAHHQAVDPQWLAPTLRVSAWSDTVDHGIEAIEFKAADQKPFFIGVQWHPERMHARESNPLSQKIKSRFLSEVRKP